VDPEPFERLVRHSPRGRLVPAATLSGAAMSLVEAQALARKPVVWEDLTTGKFHAINNKTGERIEVDRDGRPIAEFHLNVSGVASTKQRSSLRLKDVELQRSLIGPEPARPAALKDQNLFRTLREDRVETRDRFRTKIAPEAKLFLQSQRYMNATYPEIVEKAKALDDKDRAKIEEMHKNYAALQASTAAGVAPVAKVNIGATKPISKSYLSFTSTGVFRP